MTTITAQIVADSIGEHSPRLTTMLLRYPRWIHAEGRTHRVLRIGEAVEVQVRTPSLMEDENLSRNASSSRAIPVSRLIQDVLDDPATPLFWGRNQKGMQAGEELSGNALDMARLHWSDAVRRAVDAATELHEDGAHKQIVNRVLEPFSHITVVVTATQWSNFFALRRHPDAEPHIKLLADRMWEAMEASTPKLLTPGEWHLPFVDARDSEAAWLEYGTRNESGVRMFTNEQQQALVKLSVARCASTSYKTVDGFDMTLDRAIALHDKLVGSTPLHASPCEHQAKVDEQQFWSDGRYHIPVRWQHPTLGGNLGPGWVQYRKTLAGECAQC